MEYLLTYGWAILIIAVALGALFYLGVFGGLSTNNTLGVFNIPSFLGNACIAASGFLCQNPIYSHGIISANSLAGNIIVTLGQNIGQTWSTATFVFVPQGTPSSAGVPLLDWNALLAGGVGFVLSTGLALGQTQSVTLPVNGLTSNIVLVGQAATGEIWARYQVSGSTITQYMQIASINIKAS